MTQRETPPSSGPSQEIRRIAEIWAARIETGAMDDRAWADFTAWIDDASEHQDAFVEMQAWVGGIDFMRPPRTAQRTRLKGSAPVVGHGSSWPLALAAGVAGLVVLTGLSFGGLQAALRSYAQPTLFATADRPQSIRLPDESRIILNSHSSLAVAFNAQTRKVSLQQGSEADFDVKHDVARPFELTAGPTQIRVLGTAFDVKYLSELTRISVSRGAVRVSDDRGVQMTLTVGQSLVVDAISGHWSIAEVPETASWRRGQLIYDHQALSEVCADVARATNSRVELDPAARSLVFTGVLKVTDAPRMAHTLQLYLPIQAIEASGGVKITRRGGVRSL